ncbi:hypothetical protein [Saccharopolyspora griseoalba]|uniref:Uncharacterized protein n=1 Tax=Saccharopolyspora griseoalba TaxID=1431848 RepID=A0ABW2LSW5_9PSEU
MPDDAATATEPQAEPVGEELTVDLDAGERPEKAGPDTRPDPMELAKQLWQVVIEDFKTWPQAVRSPAEMTKHANEGEYTTVKQGHPSLLRKINKTWTAIMKWPTALALIIVGSWQSAARFLVFWPTVLVVMTGLAHVPLIGALVPDSLNIAAWLGM